LSAEFGANEGQYTDIVDQAGERAIRVAFADARKAFGSGIANAYVDHLTSGDATDDALRSAYVRTAALSCVSEVREEVDKKSDQIAQDLFDEHAEAIQALSDDRQPESRDIKALAP